MKKRDFLRHTGTLTIGSSILGSNLWNQVAHQSPKELSRNEDFWLQIRAGYRLKPDYINLENGYYCFIPQETLENLIHHVRQVNYQGSYYMRTNQWDNKKAMCRRLAQLIGAHEDEVIITRNTTESLDTIIGGVDWRPGDEAVMAEQDYGAMLQMFDLVADRHGVVNRRISVPNHPQSDEEIVNLYAQAITEKTRLLMVCHMINITGQILPIRKICDMAHERGVDVMVDGAHAFGHIAFDINDLDCEYYGSSLHKWLSAPLGSGLLYVKSGKQQEIWPRFGDGREKDDLWRLNHTGTHPVHTDLAIGNAIDYYLRIGPDRKEERLRYLQNYWKSRLSDHPNIVVNTPFEKQRSCGIGNVGIKTIAPSDLAERLMKEYRIWTVAIDGAGVHGCRICPNVYTTTSELDTFVTAMMELADES